jgi:thioredoxin-related protein
LKPAVDRLESETADRLEIVRVNIQDPAGRELIRAYGFEYTPTFIFFDARGSELWRQVGGLDTGRVQASIK